MRQRVPSLLKTGAHLRAGEDVPGGCRQVSSAGCRYHLGVIQDFTSISQGSRWQLDKGGRRQVSAAGDLDTRRWPPLEPSDHILDASGVDALMDRRQA